MWPQPDTKECMDKNGQLHITLWSPVSKLLFYFLGVTRCNHIVFGASELLIFALQIHASLNSFQLALLRLA